MINIVLGEYRTQRTPGTDRESLVGLVVVGPFGDLAVSLFTSPSQIRDTVHGEFRMCISVLPDQNGVSPTPD